MRRPNSAVVVVTALFWTIVCLATQVSATVDCRCLRFCHCAALFGVVFRTSSLYSCLSVLQVNSSGKFQLRLKSFANERGLNADGDCCQGIRSGGACTAACSTFFRICLKQYQTHITLDSPCTFGSVTTPVVGNNSFTLPDTMDTFENPIDLPFDFSWPVSVVVLLRV